MRKLIRAPKSDPALSPFMVIWEVTQACDLVCRHCRASAQPELHPGSLTFEQGCGLLEQVRTFSERPPIVVFTGGDPFKREDLFELIAHARQLGLVPAISPSATPLLSRDRLVRAYQAGAKAVSLSLDASTPEAHDAFRGVEGSYALTMEGWRLAQEIGLKVQVNTTVTPHNLHDLAKIFSLILENKVMTWSVFFLVPTGRGKNERQLSAEDCEAVMHFLVDACRFIGVKTTEGHHFKRVVIQRALSDEEPVFALYRELKDQLDRVVRRLGVEPQVRVKRPPMNINSGNGFVFVSHLGEVFPSGFLPLSAGNVKERSLVDIYRQSELFVGLRDPERLEGRCRNCEFRTLCAGSRSRAFAVTGNVYAEDPYCGYQPGSFPDQQGLARLLN